MGISARAFSASTVCIERARNIPTYGVQKYEPQVVKEPHFFVLFRLPILWYAKRFRRFVAQPSGSVMVG